MTTETTAAATETTALAAGEDSLTIPFEELADEARARQNDRVGAGSTEADFDECLTRVGLDDHVQRGLLARDGIVDCATVPAQATVR